MDEIGSLFVECDPEAAGELRRILEAQGSEVEGSSRRQLDGAQAESWVLVATMAVQTAPRILDALKGFLTRDAVKSVTAGDIKIENPRPEHVQQLLDAAMAHRGE